MKLRRLMSLSILVLAVVALSPATAPAATDHQVPFKGSWQSVETSTGFPFATVVLEGTGNATHLGQFTVEGNFVINLLNGSGTGTEVFTAANGDTVNATGPGQAGPAAPGFVSIVEVITITGGTGRFANATGSYTLTRLLNIVTGVSTGSFEGTISI